LPDEAVFHVTWAEEADRAKYDVIIKIFPVDFLLLNFGPFICQGHNFQIQCKEATQKTWRKGLLKLRIKHLLSGHSNFLASNSISPSAKKECNICRDISSSIKGKQDSVDFLKLTLACNKPERKS